MLFFVIAAFFACISPCLNSGAYFLVIDEHIGYTQQQAREKCNSLGAELASVHSDDDFLYIENLMIEREKYLDCFWIGLVLYWYVNETMPTTMPTAVPNQNIINISWVDGTPMDWGNPIELSIDYPTESSSSSSPNNDIWPWGEGEPSNAQKNTRNCVYLFTNQWLSAPCDTVSSFGDPVGIVCEITQQ